MNFAPSMDFLLWVNMFNSIFYGLNANGNKRNQTGGFRRIGERAILLVTAGTTTTVGENCFSSSMDSHEHTVCNNTKTAILTTRGTLTFSLFLPH